MAKKSTTKKPRAERRPRGEIDRNFFFGHLFIRAGVAVGGAIALVAALTPFNLREAFDGHMYGYLGVMTAFGLTGVALFLTGRHLRRQATHWDFD